MAEEGGDGVVEEIVSDLARLSWSLPQSPASLPQDLSSPISQGLSFSVAGLGLGRSDESSGSGLQWDNAAVLPSSELIDTALSLDFGSLDADESPSSVLHSTSNSDGAVGGDGDGESRREERGKLLVHYVGGSITFLLQIAVLAWSVRQLRRVFARRRQMREGQGVSAARINSMPFRPVDLPLFAFLSPRAVRKLVELNHVSFLLIDVRHAEAARSVPFEMDYVINIPETELRACLQLVETSWENRFPAAKQPCRTDLLVFISSKGQRAQRAAAIAAELGFNGCCVLSGGTQAYESDIGVSSINTLGRDAVAFLLQDASARRRPSHYIKHHLVDVRRYDERSLYGHIFGSLHIPAEEWPKALAMDASDWEKNYHFSKLGKDDVVILYSRTIKRAIWVAQLCSDAGMTRCYVQREGAYGWRLDHSVQPYSGYEQGDAPPEPIKFEVEMFNREAGEIELRQKGFLIASASSTSPL